MLYRFRSTDRLLNHGELEQQYFYFAGPTQQNDPMEGYAAYFWKGDLVAWLGLFKHYAWQVFMTLHLVPLKPTPETLCKLHLSQTEIHWKDTKLPELRLQVEKDISTDSHIHALAVSLSESQRELSPIELRAVLLTIHSAVLYYAHRILRQDGIEVFQDPEETEKLFSLTLSHQGIDALIPIIQNTEPLIPICKASDHVFHSLKLLSQINAAKSAHPDDYKTMLFLILDFPENYVEQIPRLSYPDWYCVCFNTNVANPAIWGYYADGHRGVCLIFKNTPDSGIRLTEMSGEKNTHPTRFPIHKVEYGAAPVRVDFFRSLGRLWGDERKHWLSHNGESSQILTGMLSESSVWREEFLSSNTRRLLIKSAAWQEEREYRIVLNDTWKDHSRSRKFRYDFNDLAGIAFGIKTPTEDKLRIVDLIRRKCAQAQRESFHFYQAVYHTETNLVALEPILFL